MSTRLSDYDYNLPEELIAQEPRPKGTSRLLVLRRASGTLEHKVFEDIVEYLVPPCVLVINETKVIPARLLGRREDTGGKVEFLLLEEKGDGRWNVLANPGRRAKVGVRVRFGDVLVGEVVARGEEGIREVVFYTEGGLDFRSALYKVGRVPLPPYIRREPHDGDLIHYQTVFARKEGAVAAPTAGLHFTEQILDMLVCKGVEIARIVLHTGLGTFRPVKTEDITQHKMHREYYEIPDESAQVINAVKGKGGKVFVVGTTCVRALESSVKDGRLVPGDGWTDLFIYPGFRFQMTDALITNFHLPKSTLLILVSAFAGRELILSAYREAIEQGYRFFSYGDAMLIL